MRSNRAKKTAMISMRIMYPFKEALKVWAARAGITYTEFVMMALVYGARRQAKILGVYEKEDDQKVELMEEYMKEWNGRKLDL